jgi:predicted SnoaL-like aldol condensation-catalyzing enzyme
MSSMCARLCKRAEIVILQPMTNIRSLPMPAVALALALAACAGSATLAKKDTTTMATNQTTQKQQVRDLLKAIETGDGGPVAVINPNQYIQHNLGAKDGLAGFGELLAQLPKGSARVNTVRVFQDGEFVFAHTDYNFFGPKIGFDVFRFEDGKIVEHWDNLQEKPTRPNPSGHTMTDGPTEATDADKTQANKALVRSFVDDILVNGRMDKLVGYYDGDHYIQHNPQIADGLSGLGAALKGMAEQGIAMKYDRIRRVLGEGNFVLVASEGSFAGKPTAFYDLFRVDAGKIAEHWDTLEVIPAKDQWQNNNGKF